MGDEELHEVFGVGVGGGIHKSISDLVGRTGGSWGESDAINEIPDNC